MAQGVEKYEAYEKVRGGLCCCTYSANEVSWQTWWQPGDHIVDQPGLQPMQECKPSPPI